MDEILCNNGCEMYLHRKNCYRTFVSLKTDSMRQTTQDLYVHGIIFAVGESSR